MLLDPSGTSFPMFPRLLEFVLSGLEEGTEPHPELLSIVLTDLDSSYAARGSWGGSTLMCFIARVRDTRTVELN